MIRWFAKWEHGGDGTLSWEAAPDRVYTVEPRHLDSRGLPSDNFVAKLNGNHLRAASGRVGWWRTKSAPYDSGEEPFRYGVVSALIDRGGSAYAAFKTAHYTFTVDHQQAPVGFVIERANSILALIPEEGA